MTLPLLLLLAAAPAIQSPPQAVARLRAAKGEAAMKAAVKDVTGACRGKLRHTLRDHPALHAEAKRIATTRSNGERKAALDLFRCFTPKKMMALIEPNLRGDDDAMIAYAAEVGARLESPVTVPPLLDVLGAKKAKCLAGGLDAAKTEVCVWLTYAIGPGLTGADDTTKKNAGAAVVEMLDAPQAKVREVAVESVTATGDKTHAQAIRALIAKEKKGAFADKNDAALLKRFSQRAKSLGRR